MIKLYQERPIPPVMAMEWTEQKIVNTLNPETGFNPDIRMEGGRWYHLETYDYKWALEIGHFIVKERNSYITYSATEFHKIYGEVFDGNVREDIKEG